MVTAKKGDRVQFPMMGDNGIETAYGVVKKGGKRNVIVVLDGGKHEVLAKAMLFELSDKPLPEVESTLMDKYSVKDFKGIGVGKDGDMFTCTICMAGKAFATVQQSGNGGPNYYHPLKVEEEYRSTLEQFKKDAQEWMKLFKTPPIDSEDLWIEWWVNYRPYGQTAAEYLKF